jgi:hypothetical protein
MPIFESSTVTDNRILIGEVRRLRHANDSLRAELHSHNGDECAPFYTSAHDLKTPLCTLETVIDALVESLGDEATSEETRNLARLVEVTSKRMRCLVDDVLDLGRVGSHNDETASVDLAALFADAVERHAHTIEKRGLIVQIVSPLPVVRGPRHDLAAVITNIVENAVKYAPHEGQHEVSVGANQGERELTVWIRDTGCGFDAAKVDEAFQAYVRCNTDVDGTGLGLAIVKKAVEGWGGRVWIHTRPDAGTSVYFTVPNGGSCNTTADRTPNTLLGLRQEELR